MASFYSDKGKVGRRTMGRAVYAGSNTVVASFTWGVTNVGDPAGVLSATGAANDIIYMAPIPHRACITRVVALSQREAGTYRIGMSWSPAQFIATTSLSSGFTNGNIGMPYRVSVSDDASVQYEWLMATVVAAGNTLSDTIQVVVEYVIDET